MKLNSFDKKSMKWTSELRNYEKFLQYHGCELVLSLPIPIRNLANYYLSGYARVDRKQTKFDIYGVTPVIFNMAANIYNYSDAYQPVQTNSIELSRMEQHMTLHSVPINNVAKTPQVSFLLQPIGRTTAHIRTSLPVADIQMYVFVTPAEAYTPYE